MKHFEGGKQDIKETVTDVKEEKNDKSNFSNRIINTQNVFYFDDEMFN